MTSFSRCGGCCKKHFTFQFAFHTPVEGHGKEKYFGRIKLREVWKDKKKKEVRRLVLQLNHENRQLFFSDEWPQKTGHCIAPPLKPTPFPSSPSSLTRLCTHTRAVVSSFLHSVLHLLSAQEGGERKLNAIIVMAEAASTPGSDLPISDQTSKEVSSQKAEETVL